MKIILALVSVALLAIVVFLVIDRKPEDGVPVAAAGPSAPDTIEGAVLAGGQREVVPPGPTTLTIVDAAGDPVVGCVVESTVLGQSLAPMTTDQRGTVTLGDAGFHAAHLIPPDGFFPCLLLGHLGGEPRVTLPGSGRILVVLEAPQVRNVELVRPDDAQLPLPHEMYFARRDEYAAFVPRLEERIRLLASGDREALDDLMHFAEESEEGPILVPRWDVFSVPHSTPDGNLTFDVPPSAEGYSVFVDPTSRVQFTPRSAGIQRAETAGFSGVLPVRSGETTTVVISAPGLSLFGCADFGPQADIDRIELTLYGENRKGIDLPILAVQTLYPSESGFCFEFYNVEPGMARVHAVGYGTPVPGEMRTVWISSSNLLWVNEFPQEAAMKVGQYSLEVETGFVDSSGQPMDHAAVAVDANARSAAVLIASHFSIGERNAIVASGHGNYDFFFKKLSFPFGEPLVIRGLWGGSWDFDLDESPEVDLAFRKPYGAMKTVKITDRNPPLLLQEVVVPD